VIVISCGSDSNSSNGSDSNGGGGGGSSGAAPENDPMFNGITAAHNSARASVIPAAQTPIPPLEWSSSVAAEAQAWADNCRFEHDLNSSYGQNLFATPGGATAEEVIAAWTAEQADYDYATDSCAGTCGHYTQVVWAQSRTLGCGVRTCAKNSPFRNGKPWQFWVCDYDPPGNFIGERPY